MNVTTLAVISSVAMIIIGIGARVFLKKIDKEDKGIRRDGTK